MITLCDALKAFIGSPTTPKSWWYSALKDFQTLAAAFFALAAAGVAYIGVMTRIKFDKSIADAERKAAEAERRAAKLDRQMH